MKIKIQSEEELLEVAQEAIHILSNLRNSTKLWNIHHGAAYREIKHRWEEKADLFLEKLQVTSKDSREQIKIEVDEKD